MSFCPSCSSPFVDREGAFILPDPPSQDSEISLATINNCDLVIFIGVEKEVCGSLTWNLFSFLKYIKYCNKPLFWNLELNALFFFEGEGLQKLCYIVVLLFICLAHFISCFFFSFSFEFILIYVNKSYQGSNDGYILGHYLGK